MATTAPTAQHLSLSPPKVTSQPEPPATQSLGRGALHKQLQFTTVLISETLMSLIEIFFSSPGEKAVAEFASWEISVSGSNLEDE